MWQRLRPWWWPVGKCLLAVVILVAIGWHFARDLPVVWQRSYDPGWLVAAGALFLAGVAFSAFYWRGLLLQVGQRPTWATVVRAYYVGRLGQYVPGKAVAVVLRAGLATGPTVKAGYAALTTFYEVLTTMAAGVLLAGGLVLLLLPDTSPAAAWRALPRLFRDREIDPALLGRGPLALASLGLFAAIAVPLLPPVFNRVVHRLSLPFRDRDAAPLALLEARVLPEGLLLTMVGWALLGASTWAALRATVPALPWTWDLWGRVSAYMGLAYVLGFAASLPSGLGVRELFLTVFLASELVRNLGLSEVEAGSTAFATVIVLRVVWTVAEVLTAAVVYWLPVPRAVAAEGGVA
jgi:uncharacterized membrane protein YbhN (UPF0104 family)